MRKGVVPQSDDIVFSPERLKLVTFEALRKQEGFYEFDIDVRGGGLS